MADFLTAHKLTAINEGGYTADPKDSGNWYKGKLIGTNKGISAPVLAGYLKRMPTVDEMKQLSDEVALSIYKKNYWDEMWGDKWISQDNANNVYDMCVNAGVQTSIKIWQHAIGVPETGKMNTQTLNRTNLS